MEAPALVAFVDYTCPYSYLTEAGVLSRLRAEGGVRVEYRACELWPAPEPLPDAGSPERRREWRDRVQPLARQLGVEIRRPAVLPRTRKAHEAAAFARTQGRFEEMLGSLFRAYFVEGRDIGRVDALVELGAALGLDRTALKVALDIDQLTDRVLADEAEARSLGVTGLPTLVLPAETLVGFHDYETVRGALRRA